MKAKTIIAVLSVANLALLGTVGYLLTRDPAPDRTRLDPLQSTNLLTTIATDPPSQSPPKFAAKAFHWRQLESTNYQIYIKNLRRVGCPEQTVYDIVAAEVHGQNGPRREQLRQQEVQLGRSLEMEREKLGREEANLVATLLGYPLPDGTLLAEAASPAETADKPVVEREIRVSWPAVLAPLDRVSTNFNSDQLALIERLRQKFLKDIGGIDQDPNDPAYLERWQTAQAKIDQSLKTMMGINDFQRFEREARRLSLSNSAAR